MCGSWTFAAFLFTGFRHPRRWRRGLTNRLPVPKTGVEKPV
jgi:hypothetical protein